MFSRCFSRCFSRLMPFRWPVHRPSCPIHPSSRGSCSARLSSTSPSPPPQASPIDRITAKLPRCLQAYTTRLRNAPASHVVSFLILHEFTAIVPLLALFALFHYTTYLPISYLTQHLGDQIESGLERYERYFRRKGWFGFDQEDSEAQPNQMTDSREKAHTRDLMQRWGSGDTKYKILVEAALAYAITKALLPIRIIGSVWATPWFASVLMRIKDIFTRKP